MPITFTTKGDYKKTNSFLERALELFKLGTLDKYGREGVEALSKATPKRTGKTAASWSYEIERTNHSVSIIWSNSNENQGRNIAILIEFGHGTRNGGYVKATPYIKPAMKKVFKDAADSLWKEIIKE